ncbi:hypothetical protein Tco_0668984 [Tanacetum coccineum]
MSPVSWEKKELARPLDTDKAEGSKKKGAGSSGSSSSMNDEALARLMVPELAMKKKERLAFLEIRRRKVKIRERELAMQEYKQCQKDIMFYVQPYNHLTRDTLKQIVEIRVGIKEK